MTARGMLGSPTEFPFAQMQIFIARLVAVLLVGIAPLAVAAGFCAGQACCPRSDELRVAAADCCNEIVCTDVAPDELARTETPKDAATPAPAIAVTASVVRPPSTLMLAPSRVPAKSGAERLSSLSILLI